MRTCIAILLWCGLLLKAGALPTAERTEGDLSAQAVLARPCILVTTTGQLPLAYSGMARVFASPNLLGDVQREYARQLPPGQKPEFVIEQTAPGTYQYVNREGHESNIREVHRAEHEGPVTELVLHTSGRRFFGRFEAVVHVAVFPLPQNQLGYTAIVHAYPENGLSRFLARHLGWVERYFHSKTRDIEVLSTRLGEALCASAVAFRPADETWPGPRSVR